MQWLVNVPEIMYDPMHQITKKNKNRFNVFELFVLLW